MAEDIEKLEQEADAAAETTATTKKRRGRGVSNETKSTNLKRFSDKDMHKNGLFTVRVESIKVKWSTASSDSDGVFAGEKLPRLEIHYTSPHSNPNERRHIIESYGPVESSVETIPGGKAEWKINVIFQNVKHLIDVLVLRGKRTLTEEEEEMLTLDLDDYEYTSDDENALPEFKETSVSEVIAAYRKLFENVEKIINEAFDGKPAFKNEKGEDIILWIKLLRYYKDKNKWKTVSRGNMAGQLAIPAFVENGKIEIFREGKEPTLAIDPVKEKVLFNPNLVDENSTGALNLPNSIGGAGTTIPGMPTGIPYAGGGVTGQPADDLPF